MILRRASSAEGPLTFSGCSLGGTVCTSEGQAAGRLTSQVQAVLAYDASFEQPPTKVSDELNVDGIVFSCGERLTGLVFGDAFGENTGDVDVMSNKFTDSWHGDSGLVVEVGGLIEPAGLDAGLSFKGKQKIEVKT
jgi:hypothetical protein